MDKYIYYWRFKTIVPFVESPEKPRNKLSYEELLEFLRNNIQRTLENTMYHSSFDLSFDEGDIQDNEDLNIGWVEWHEARQLIHGDLYIKRVYKA